MSLEEVLVVITVIGAMIIFPILPYIRIKKIDGKKVNDESYQRYEKFYDNIVASDKEFDTKINKIYTSIVKDKKKNIKEIAKDSGCSYDECIFKINYLKHKNMLDNYFLDKVNGLVLPCEKSDIILLNRYKNYLYKNNFQIEEMVMNLPNCTLENKDNLMDKVYKDIVYLYKKGLLTGIKINEIDKKILYYDVEKEKAKKLGKITIHCPNCGALNDIDSGSKVRCGYCKTIIDDEV